MEKAILNKILHSFNIPFFIGMMLLFFSFESANAEGNSPLVGKWVITKTITEYYTTIPEFSDMYNRTEEESGNGEYWIFTSSTVTVYDSNDVMNDKEVAYSYDASTGQLHLQGFFDYTVKELTAESLVLHINFSVDNFGQNVTIIFKKEIDSSSIDDINIDNDLIQILDLSGRIVRSDASSEYLNNLRTGVYIVVQKNGTKKIAIK